LIAGSGNSFIATLVERHTRFVPLAKVVNKDSHSVIHALIKQSCKLPKELYRSLTWHRGCEMAGHKTFALATDINVSTKGTDLSIDSQVKLSAVARQFNERPRKTLGYETPTERFSACVALTG
jgi:IS30 family transposase